MKLSVIVCTQNRAYAIVGCLDSIVMSLSAAAPVEAEIVVVDNASSDDTSAVVKKWAETCAFPVRLLYEPKKGLSAARNCALRAAQGDLLAFTDDDCRLSKMYVADALRHTAADTGLVFRGGRVELGDPADLPLTIQTNPKLIRWRCPVKGGKYVPLDGGCILGCNMLMRRTLAERIGFFDEHLGAGTSLPAGEDTDYIFRAYLAGVTIEYVPDMVVFHYHGRKTAAEGKKLFQNYMIGTGALYMKYLFKYPDFCRQFYWDFKDAMREIFLGKKDFFPENIGFSYKLRVLFCAHGAFRYCLLLMRKGQ